MNISTSVYTETILICSSGFLIHRIWQVTPIHSISSCCRCLLFVLFTNYHYSTSVCTPTLAYTYACTAQLSPLLGMFLFFVLSTNYYNKCFPCTSIPHTPCSPASTPSCTHLSQCIWLAHVLWPAGVRPDYRVLLWYMVQLYGWVVTIIYGPAWVWVSP